MKRDPPRAPPPNDGAELRRRAEELLRPGKPSPGAIQLDAADTRHLLHELQAHQIELELQNEELRRSQSEIEAALERFADFHDFSPAGFFSLDRDGAIARLNLTGARLLGQERDRLAGRRFSAFVAAADRPRFKAFLQGAFAGEAAQNCELELAIAGLAPQTVQITATLSPDRQECRAVVVDVTGYKRIEQALRESERRFRDVADISADWIWEVDLAGRYTYASESVRVLLGYAPEDIIGRTAFDLMPPDEALRVGAAFAAIVMREESFRDLENIVLDSIGGRHDTLSNGTPIRDAAGRMIGYRGVDRDISRRRQAEENLALLAASLDKRVVERTRELRRVSAQLTMFEERERRKLAEDLHDNLGQLLAVIKIKLTSLPDDLPQAALGQVVDLVEQADRAARSITQQLSPPILNTLGLGPALEWLGEETGRSFGLKVHVDVGECGKRLVDEVQAVLYRAARELLINAAKHAGVKEASLTCLCHHERLVLVVSDAGKGFEPAEHIGAGHGHGSFGLRSIHERMINLGGEVDIDSSPGNGTTVTLSVPRIIEGKEICDDPNNACR